MLLRLSSLRVEPVGFFCWGNKMLVGHVSDEYYAALADVQLELRGRGIDAFLTRSSASGAIYSNLSPGRYDVCLSRPGFGAKRVTVEVGKTPLCFRLLSDRLLGYSWPKWC